MNNIRQIKTILYKLKKEFGRVLTILTTTSITQDVQTGAINRNERVITVRRAIVLEQKTDRKFSYDLSFIAANKNFTYGGLFDVGIRLVIVDKADLPKDYIPTLDDRCIIDGVRYQVGNSDNTVYNLGIMLQLKTNPNQKVENVIQQSINHMMSPEQGVTNA